MTETSPKPQRGPFAFIVFAVVTVCILVAALWFVGWNRPLAARRNPETEDAYAAGDQTPLSARVEGYLRRLDIDDNQAVRAGQPIAELVDDDYRANVAQAQADLDASRAELRQLQEQERVLDLQVAQSSALAGGVYAEQHRAAAETARQAILLPTVQGLKRNYDTAAADNGRLAAQGRAQDAQTEQRLRSIDVLKAQQQRAVASIALRQAQLDLANIRLGYTVLRAPVDGTVGARQVRVGTLLQPGNTVVVLTPLASVWVVANFTERQMGGVHPGQAALVRFDTFPDVQLPAHVAGISPLTGGQLSAVPADNATGNYTKVVQRVAVKVTLDTDGNTLMGRIRPGMSALVRVMTDGVAPVRPAR